MFVKIWLAVVTAILLLNMRMIVDVNDEVQRIKSWYPFVEICKIKIPKDKEAKK